MQKIQELWGAKRSARTGSLQKCERPPALVVAPRPTPGGWVGDAAVPDRGGVRSGQSARGRP